MQATGRILLCLLLLCCALHSILAKKELKFLQVLSTNKFYVPDYDPESAEFQVPKNLSYGYFLNNAVDIPNSVKMALFNLGEQLRSKYGNFIGSLYSDEVIKMQTVGFPTSIMAGELINAGLWPPVDGQIWNQNLAWQPVPFEYTSVDEDTLLLGTLCPNFKYDTRKVLKDHYNSSASHEQLLKYIKENVTINVENPIDALMLHLALDNGRELNQSLPQWIGQIYPSDDLTNLSLAAYDLLSTTTLQRRLNGGSFLKRLVADWKSHVNGILHKDRKIHVYSGDDKNFAGILKNLNLAINELPKPGDALIFELLSESNQFYVQVIRYSGDTRVSFAYKLPGCETYCPIEKFHQLVADFLPENELSLCGSMIEESANGTANSITTSYTLISFVSLISLYLTTKI